MSRPSPFSAVAMIGTGIAINAVYQVRHGRDPVPVIFVGSIFMGAVVFLAQVQPEVGNAFAAVYLLSVVLTRGTEFFEWAAELTSGLNYDGSVKKTTKKKDKP